MFLYDVTATEDSHACTVARLEYSIVWACGFDSGGYEEAEGERVVWVEGEGEREGGLHVDGGKNGMDGLKRGWVGDMNGICKSERRTIFV